MLKPPRTTSRFRPRAIRKAAGRVFLMVCVLAFAAAGASADARSDLDKAKQRMEELQGQVASQQASVTALQAQLEEVGARFGQAQSVLEGSQRRLLDLEEELSMARAAYADVRDRLNLRVREIYMEGPGSGIDALLSTSTFADLVEGVEFVDSVGSQDANLAREAQDRAEDVAAKTERLDRAIGDRAGVVRELGAQRQLLLDAFAQQQTVLQELAASRQELSDLVEKLEGKLAADLIASARQTAGAGMPLSYGQWAALFLDRFEAPACQENLIAVVAWLTSEGTQASWNPLATTLSMPGAGIFNSHGVRNYVSLEQGLEASYLTIQNGLDKYRYGAIVESLQRCGDAMETGMAINQSSWCYGCTGGRYVIGIIPVVRAYYERYANN